MPGVGSAAVFGFVGVGGETSREEESLAEGLAVAGLPAQDVNTEESKAKSRINRKIPLNVFM
jgi:hypothetical protein